MTPIRLVLLVCLPVLGVAQPAMANMPPGPQVALSMISILPLMMFLTLVGGGYAVLRHLGQKRMGRQDLTGLLAGIVLLCLVGMNGQVASLLTVGFGLIALVRGRKMIVWGLRTRVKQAKPAFLDSAQAGRLLPAGGVLVILAAFVMGMGTAFSSYVRETPYQADYEQQLQAFVTYQLIYAEVEQAETGKRRFRRFSDEKVQEKFFSTPMA